MHFIDDLISSMKEAWSRGVARGAPLCAMVFIFGLFLCIPLMPACADYEDVLAKDSIRNETRSNAINFYKKKQYEEAYRILQPLAEQGDAVSQYYVSSIEYVSSGKVGVGGLDYKEWMEISARGGYPPAQADYARSYIYGERKGGDWNKISDYLNEAANNDNVIAQRFLARLYTTGERGKDNPHLKKNLKEAYKWTLRSATQGDLFSAEKMIKIFRDGRGVKRNMEEAMFWCRVYLRHVPLRFYRGHNGANIGSTCRWTVENHLTKPQIEKAKVRAAQWKSRPIDEDLKQELLEEEKNQREVEALMKPKYKKD